jgi:hypothetical protein
LATPLGAPDPLEELDPPLDDAPCEDDCAKHGVPAMTLNAATNNHRRQSAVVIKARMNSPLS